MKICPWTVKMWINKRNVIRVIPCRVFGGVRKLVNNISEVNLIVYIISDLDMDVIDQKYIVMCLPSQSPAFQ